MSPRTREELLSYAVIEPALQSAIATHPLRGPQPSDPYYSRTDFEAQRLHRVARLQEKCHLRFLPGPIPDQVKEEDREVTVRDGSKVTVRVYAPIATPSRGSPLIVMYHEGGWSMGDLSDEEVNCRLFSREFGAVCVNVDYRLAPENPFPTSINDCWDVLQWVAVNTSTLGADPALGFIVGGGSAGGNITAVLTHLAHDASLSPPLTGQYLNAPAIMCLLPPSDIPEKYRAEYLSHPAVTKSQDPVLRADAEDPTGLMTKILKADLDSPLMVPFHFGKVGGLDPLRDEALIYERVLREEAGVKTRLDIYPGLGHYFHTNFPLLDQSKHFMRDTIEGIRWLLVVAQTP